MRVHDLLMGSSVSRHKVMSSLQIGEEMANRIGGRGFPRIHPFRERVGLISVARTGQSVFIREDPRPLSQKNARLLAASNVGLHVNSLVTNGARSGGPSVD